MKKILFIFLLLFLITYFFRSSINEIITGGVVFDENDEEINLPYDFGDINLYFCQVDNCEEELLKKIKESNKVECAFFELNLENIKSELKNKDYRLILDDRKSKEVSLVYIDDERKELMHNKFCIFDDSIVFTGSFNPTVNDNTKNDNNIVIIKSEVLAENYKDEFNEMWNGNFGRGEIVRNPKLYFNNYLIENYFCPEDKCEEHVLDLLKTAKNRVYFMIFSFTSDKLGDEIIKSYHYGLDVKGIIDKTQAGSEFSEFNKMKEIGMNVIKFRNKGFMHHKVFIVDDTVVFGSYNPSKSGNKDNDENILIIHDSEIANEFLYEFDRIYGVTKS